VRRQKALNEERNRSVGRINVIDERMAARPDPEPATKKHKINQQIMPIFSYPIY
jgi:hypothetical protein